jgi:hypothetical protein
VVLVRGVYGELADVRLDASERGRFAHGCCVDIGVILFSGFSVLVSCIISYDVVRKRTKQGVFKQ